MGKKGCVICYVVYGGVEGVYRRVRVRRVGR